MIISKEQIQTLGHMMEVTFVERLTRFIAGLRQKMPGSQGVDAVKTGDPKELCVQLISRARAKGLQSEYEIAVYAACAIRVGLDFDQREDLPFRKILARPATEPRLKAAQMSMELDQMTAAPGAEKTR